MKTDVRDTSRQRACKITGKTITALKKATQ